MPRHVIVDGSNIATEGRQMPSLKQLSEAVSAFMQEFPDDVITVVVDATFGHRIDPSEVAEFDEAVAHNELVAPPAGAIGRGDSFILSIANKTKGSILTNDSYQEFHGEYPWVFDEGRLIGGKPVPNVGWVFVLRTPVRGPVSRKSVKAGRSVNKNTGRAPRASKEASLPMPVPKVPPPGAIVAKAGRGQASGDGAAAGELVGAGAGSSGGRGGRRGRGRGDGQRDGQAPAEKAVAESAATVDATPRPAPVREEPVNELMAFINFVEHHPVGSSVNAVVESYSSHGAYVSVGDVRGYVPLRLMSDPPARSARELGKVGDAVTLVVHSFTPARRSIDMAVPAAALRTGVAPATVPVEPHAAETAAIAEAAVIASAEPAADAKPAKAAKLPAKRGSKRSPKQAPSVAADDPSAVADVAEVASAPVVETGSTARRPARRPKKAAAVPETAPATAAPVAPAPAKTAAAAKKATAKKAAADPTPKAPRKATAKKAAATAEPLPFEATPAPPVKRAAKKAAATATPTDSPAPTKAPAKKTAAKKATSRTAAAPAPVEPAPTKKAPAKRASAAAGKKAPAKKAAATKAPAKRAAAKPRPS